ncbi:RagB/SusD family nutrient uptake outer membrane protein [Pedobacter sp. ISL-68]|uniref:RagB/SusD family nutrient uptake outer membrane protein n=1 Tax=unclassified Pedobacter TaxID=2628915 RepID=UPI001BE965A5|nr:MULTISPECIES: RagB/SusD family nutrient uptake outer membrane protein [unclassified Pedobacter]MBT2561797.1 RagB/SusD family nutrient uptake outer membrane protein [Pedobacter sp. ISL-64]MBT2591185.1 RagB/SusD family nutrient uptake outer membrane protein [Pedobacter sp. ISL-68]
MKKYITIFASLSVLFIAFSSCKKSYLDEKPFSSYTPLTLTDSLGFEASLIGLYNHTSTIFSWADQQGWPSVWQVGTDVANATNNQQGVEIPYYNYALLTSLDVGAGRTWNRNYIMVNLTNIILDGIENPSVTTLSAAGKNSVSAEAKFFRAYAYNNLATLFGGVPLVTQALTGPKIDFVRAPIADVNNLIVADLLFAAANLPDIEAVKTNTKGKMYGRANKFMAMQLLAEVYLRIGKPDLAEQQAQAIISSGKFSLIRNRYGVKTGQPGDYYSDMFQYGNERRVQGNTEAIWVLEQENPTAVVGGITDNPQQRRVWGAAYYNIAGMALADSLGGRSIGRLRLSNWVLYGLYKGNDIRNSQYNIRRRYYYNDPNPIYAARYGKQVPFTGPDTLVNICPSTTKWGAFDPNDTFGYAMIKDFILMRLGETYLLLAEAQVAQGKTAEAATTINVLRTRANAAQVSAAEMTKDFILDERARELIGEENRRMTLMRTGTLVERTLRLNANDASKPITGLTTKNLLLPIPLSEIQLNKDAVLTQNPGY